MRSTQISVQFLLLVNIKFQIVFDFKNRARVDEIEKISPFYVTGLQPKIIELLYLIRTILLTSAKLFEPWFEFKCMARRCQQSPNTKYLGKEPNGNLVPRVLSLPPSRKYPGFGWSRVSLKQTPRHQGGLAFLQEAKGKANANLFKLARRQRNGSH